MKRLATDLLEDTDALARFRREAEIVARFRHPNIVEVSDWETLDDGSPCIIMEFLHGEDLSRRLRAGGPLPWPVLARIADQVMPALSVAHRGGIIHCDLKPQNIFLAKDDTGDERAFTLARLRRVPMLSTKVKRHPATPPGRWALVLAMAWLVSGCLYTRYDLLPSAGVNASATGVGFTMRTSLETGRPIGARATNNFPGLTVGPALMFDRLASPDGVRLEAALIAGLRARYYFLRKTQLGTGEWCAQGSWYQNGRRVSDQVWHCKAYKFEYEGFALGVDGMAGYGFHREGRVDSTGAAAEAGGFARVSLGRYFYVEFWAGYHAAPGITDPVARLVIGLTWSSLGTEW